MACVLTTGFNLDCKDGIGGVKDVWVIPNANKGTITKSTSGTITAWTGNGSIFKYQLPKESGQFDPKIQGDKTAGTTFYPGQFTFPFRKMDAPKSQELKLLAQNTLILIIKDKNGVYWVVGEDSGADLVTAEGTSGKAMGDFNGWNVTLEWAEPAPPYVLDAGVVTSLGLT